MKITLTIAAFAAALMLGSCNSNDASSQGHSTPIDSTNVNGTAPATYGGDNPRNDTNKVNVDDTGTKADNVSNTGR